jgi:hypothetical protein
MTEAAIAFGKVGTISAGDQAGIRVFAQYPADEADGDQLGFTMARWRLNNQTGSFARYGLFKEQLQSIAQVLREPAVYEARERISDEVYQTAPGSRDPHLLQFTFQDFKLLRWKSH